MKCRKCGSWDVDKSINYTSFLGVDMRVHSDKGETPISGVSFDHLGNATVSACEDTDIDILTNATRIVIKAEDDRGIMKSLVLTTEPLEEDGDLYRGRYITYRPWKA